MDTIDTSKKTLIKEFRLVPEQVVETKDGITTIRGFGKIALHDGEKVVDEIDNGVNSVTMTKMQVITGNDKERADKITKAGLKPCDKSLLQ